MWHTFQKNMSWYKPSKVIEDPEFNQLFEQLRCLIPRTRDLLASFNKTEKAWLALRDNYKQLLGLMNPKHDVGSLAWELCERGQIEIQRWEQLRPLRQAPLSNEASEFAQAKQALAEYHAALLDTYAVGEKRTKVLRDLNYFNGKLEYASARKEIDPSEYHITLYDQENILRTYTRINRAAVEDMKEALALGELMINRCLGAYLRLQKELASGLNPFLKTPEKMPETENAKWPHITPLALKVKQHLQYLANPNDKTAPKPQITRDAEAVKYADPNFALRLASRRTPSNSSRGSQGNDPLFTTASESVLIRETKDIKEEGVSKEGGVRSASMPAVVVVGLKEEGPQLGGAGVVKEVEGGSGGAGEGKGGINDEGSSTGEKGEDTETKEGVNPRGSEGNSGKGGEIDIARDINEKTGRSKEVVGRVDDIKEVGLKLVKEDSTGEGSGIADSS
eukprot:comp20715_c0_seq1/m.27043 comp20715_c0_seq1/g.27043  ORF comp20715_c0_seq1/g.27043 comp20715_c0_seq1/m.27043 type:complete len:450 (-) comp20715_c0_seq1:42-1391(-)